MELIHNSLTPTRFGGGQLEQRAAVVRKVWIVAVRDAASKGCTPEIAAAIEDHPAERRGFLIKLGECVQNRGAPSLPLARQLVRTAIILVCLGIACRAVKASRRIEDEARVWEPSVKASGELIEFRLVPRAGNRSAERNGRL